MTMTSSEGPPLDATPLVSTEWLGGRLGDPAIRIAEVKQERENTDYESGHVPGALSWYWKDIFWDELSREFASPQQMAERLSAQGISNRHTLVLYSARVQFAIYGYWVLTTMCGHQDVRVLDGGRHKWTRENRALITEVPATVSVPCQPARTTRDDSTRARRDEVLARIGTPGTVLVDGRSDEEYSGRRVKPGTGPDHGAERHGHIPGAVHLPSLSLLNEDWSFRPRADLERMFRAAGAAPDQAAEVITYCRLGHRASMAWFAMTKLLGWQHVRVYDGSWTEWGSCVGLPVQRDIPAGP